MNNKKLLAALALAAIVIAVIAVTLALGDDEDVNPTSIGAPELEGQPAESVIARSAPRLLGTREGARFDSGKISLRRPAVPNEVIVAYRKSASPARQERVRASVGGQVVDRLPLISETELIQISPETTVNEAIKELESDPNVLFAQPNYIRFPSGEPNDPRFAEMWGLNNTGIPIWDVPGVPGADIDAPAAWDITTGTKNVVVAVVDTGVAYDHPELASNMWTNPGEIGDGKDVNGVDDDGNGFVDDVRGWDWVDQDNDPRDVEGHGSHVAGTIAAEGNDGEGVTGVAWQTTIMPLRVIGPDGVPDSTVAKAFAYAAKTGAPIVNASLGGRGSSPILDQTMVAAPQTLFVLAAGNDSANVDAEAHWPCATEAPNAICVAATNNNDTLASFSNFGATQVDIAAPGEGILSTIPNIDYVLEERFNADPLQFADGEGQNLWTAVPDPEYAGSRYVTESAEGSYADNLDTSLRSTQPIDLSGRSRCHLYFLVDLQLADTNDVFSVETSADGTNWSPLAGSEKNTSTPGWVNAQFDLASVLGSSFHLRFHLRTDAAGNADGVKIDAVRVECLEMSYVGDEFDIYDGTSMASPHVAGVAALLKALVPQATPDQLKQALFQGAEPLPSLTGRMTTGARLNAHRSLLQIQGGL